MPQLDTLHHTADSSIHSGTILIIEFSAVTLAAQLRPLSTPPLDAGKSSSQHQSCATDNARQQHPDTTSSWEHTRAYCTSDRNNTRSAFGAVVSCSPNTGSGLPCCRGCGPAVLLTAIPACAVTARQHTVWFQAQQRSQYSSSYCHVHVCNTEDRIH